MREIKRLEVYFNANETTIEKMKEVTIKLVKDYFNSLKLDKGYDIYIDEFDIPLDVFSIEEIANQVAKEFSKIESKDKDFPEYYNDGAFKFVIDINKSYNNFVPTIFGKVILKMVFNETSGYQKSNEFELSNLFILNKEKLIVDFQTDLDDFIKKQGLTKEQICFFKDKFLDPYFNRLPSKTVDGIASVIIEEVFQLIKKYLEDALTIELDDISSIVSQSDISLFLDKLTMTKSILDDDSIIIAFLGKRLFKLEKKFVWENQY